MPTEAVGSPAKYMLVVYLDPSLSRSVETNTVSLTQLSNDSRKWFNVKYKNAIWSPVETPSVLPGYGSHYR